MAVRAVQILVYYKAKEQREMTKCGGERDHMGVRPKGVPLAGVSRAKVQKRTGKTVI